MIEKLNLVYFSPTGTSCKVVKAIGDIWGTHIEVNEVNLTYTCSTLEFVDSASLTVFAAPVYGGRLPRIFLHRLANISGKGALCVIVVVYGNRDYDDALLELKDEVVRRGFIPVAAACFVGEHSYSTKLMPIASGRPDTDDLCKARQFGIKIRDLINSETTFDDLYVPGHYPYKELKPLRQPLPISTDDCNSCGVCISSCPSNAIEFDSNGKIQTVSDRCIRCCACVRNCVNGARLYETPFTKILFENCTDRKTPEFYF